MCSKRVKVVHTVLEGVSTALLVELHLLRLLKMCILGALPCEVARIAHVSQNNSLRIFIGSFVLFCIAYKIYTRLYNSEGS